MRNFISIILLTLPFLSMSQLTDTTCIKSRWIALKPTEVNKDIFLMNSDFNDNIDLVFTVKQLVEYEKINIYNPKQNTNCNNDALSWYNNEYRIALYNKNNQSLEQHLAEPYFKHVVQSTVPYLNQHGEDSIYISEDGMSSIAFLPPEIYIFPSRIPDEIRIRENRVFNEKKKQYEFVATSVSFYFNASRYYQGYESFWIDLSELFDAIEDKDKYPWYQAITKNNYQGFQYMQVSCYDDGN